MEENAKDGTDQVKSGWSDWFDSGRKDPLYFAEHRHPSHRWSDMQAEGILHYQFPTEGSEDPSAEPTTTVRYVTELPPVAVPKNMIVTVVDLLEKLHLLEERQDRLFTELQELRKQMEGTHASGHSEK